ncbi:putative ion transporter superfamily protein YfcC [Elusimicrobium simillimum]|uniref:YfcC family protein n=1 Tax=Elusimicrobium simillimum TaxID=3143438 RepID=UPI003C6F89BE
MNKGLQLNIYALIFGITIIMAALTWVLPAGSYDRVERDGRSYTVAGTYHSVERSGQGIADILQAPIKGFTQCAEIIIFIFITGAIFTIIERTGTISSIINNTAYFFANNPKLKVLFIPVCMFIFSVGGAIFGMEEETLIFIPVFIPLALSLGYDSVVGVSIPFLGAWAGFCSAFMNPFTVGISQNIAQLPLYSGMGYRVLVWFICTSVIVAFVAWYGEKVRKHPKKSITYQDDLKKKESLNMHEFKTKPAFSARHKIVAVVFALSMCFLVYGVARLGWYITEIGALFLGCGIICAAIGKLPLNKTTDAIIQGAGTMIGVAIMLALARGIVVVAGQGNILDTILNFIALLIGKLHPLLALQGMFVSHTIINFFIASGSGQSVLTMPIMIPLGDIIGLSRQAVILAYQFGEGWTNAIIPTAPVTIAAIGMAGISWIRWAKWILVLQVILFFVSMLLLIPPFLSGW